MTEFAQGEDLYSYHSDNAVEFNRCRRQTYAGNIRYRWKSKWDFISCTMACTYSMNAFDTFASREFELGFLQYIVWAIFFALPLFYMQLLLGQYTQLGTILFKYLTPIGHGLGLVLITNLFLNTIKWSLLLDDSVVYFVSSFRSELQWMNCSNRYNIACWDITKTCRNCINTTYYMPGFIYLYFHYLQNPEMDTAKATFAIPHLRQVVTHFFCWVITCIVLMFTTNHFIKAIKGIWVSCLILLTFLVFGCVLPDGKKNFMSLLSVGTSSFTSYKSWTNTLNKAVAVLGLGRAFHIVHGSFMSNSFPIGMLPIIVILFHFILTCATSLLTFACVNKIAYYTNTDDEHMGTINWSGIPQMWSCIYFSICILLNLNQQLTHLMTMEKCLNDFFPNLVRYRKYTLGMFSIFSATAGCLFLSRVFHESHAIYKSICYTMLDCSELLSVVVMCILVCWIYGVQRFCDDIHFVTGKETAKFWKYCWFMLPFIALAAHIDVIFLHIFQNAAKQLRFLLYFIFSCPIPIMAIVQTFKFLKQRMWGTDFLQALYTLDQFIFDMGSSYMLDNDPPNVNCVERINRNDWQITFMYEMNVFILISPVVNLFALFQPQERFGSPDITDRQLRRQFNPRKETKSMRRMQMCYHRCLLDSKTLNSIIYNESDFRIKFTTEQDDYGSSGSHEEYDD